MMLAHMIAVDEDALICDMAQYYNVYDYEQLPAEMAAVLAYGLPEESRIKRAMTKTRYTFEQTLLAAVYDCVHMLLWLRTKDGVSGRNRPESLLAQMFPKEEKKELKSFTSAEEFETARAKLLRKGGEDA